MKIYFAGSIRGGRDDMALYMGIINLLSSYGEVLTEHIGHKNLSALGETTITDEYIYQRDMKWLGEADLIVAEVSTASLGVGYEIGYATNLQKPILCLYRDQAEKKLSAMINGNPKLLVKNYQQLDDVTAILKDFFTKFTC